MLEHEDDYDDAIILPADMSLLKKVGKLNLDKVLSKDAILRAEKIVRESEDKFYEHCLEQASQLQEAYASARENTPKVDGFLKRAGPQCFSIKTCSGQAGYELVAALAKSLHELCEDLAPTEATPAFMKVIEWHVDSIQNLLKSKTKGVGGDLGVAILAEIKRYGTRKQA